MSRRSPKTPTKPPEEVGTRVAILDAAWALLAERGEADVSLSDIAKQAGLSRQAVYLHFSGRGELLANLIEHIHERLAVQQRRQRVERAATVPELLHELSRFSAEYTPLIYPFARALDAVRRHDEVAKAAWEGRQRSRLERAKAIAQRLAAGGALRAGLNTATAADLIWTLTSLEMWEHLVVQRGWSSQRYARELEHLLAATLLATPKR